MSLTLKMYDDSIKAYYKEIFENVVYAQTDLAFRESAKLSGVDKPLLPLVSVFRTPNIQSGTHSNDPGFRRGRMDRTDPNTTITGTLRLLPVELEYQVDIWATNVEESLAIFSELLFHLKEYPAFEVVIPGTETKLSHVIYVTELLDGTDLLEEEERGRFSRMTITTTVEAFIVKTGKGTKVPKFIPIDWNGF